MLTLLTATGCRPEAWAICEQLMMRQDYSGSVHWIIVDDGEVQQPITFERDGWVLTVIRPEPFWKAGDNTQARNLRAGLELVKDSDKLVIIEDDDCYSENYLSTIDIWLSNYDLVGESHARYYNLKSRKYRYLSNSNHASLCSTAMTNGGVKYFRTVCKDSILFIDLDLWRYPGSKNLFRTNMVVGIKGMTGREGIGMGHKADFSGDKDNSSIFRSWVGKNAKLYE